MFDKISLSGEASLTQPERKYCITNVSPHLKMQYNHILMENITHKIKGNKISRNLTPKRKNQRLGKPKQKLADLMTAPSRYTSRTTTIYAWKIPMRISKNL